MSALMKALTFFAFICIFFSCKKESATASFNGSSVTTETDSKTLDGATRLVSQPGPSDGQDDQIDFITGNSGSYNNNWSERNEFAAYAWTSGGNFAGARSLIKFEALSLIPATAKILSAELSFYGVPNSFFTPQGNYGDNSCNLQRVVGNNWNESTATYNNQPPTTELDEALIPASTKQWNYNVTVDVTQMVKRMVANPSKNYGFKMRLVTEDTYRSMVFASSEYSDSTKRPKLTVRYKQP